jgi:hypothetical protein
VAANTTPHCPDAEKAVLGSLLQDPVSLASIREFLRPEDFMERENGQIFSVLVNLIDQGKPLDAVLLVDVLVRECGFNESDAVTRIGQLIDPRFQVHNAKPYALQVAEAAQRREVLRQITSLECGAGGKWPLEDLQAHLRMMSDSIYTNGVPRLVSLTGGELLAREIPDREMLLDPIIPSQSLVMLHAKRGIGKTFLALGIADAVATGHLFLRWQAEKPRPVLYVDGELPGRVLQDRFRLISGGSSNENLRFISPDFQTSYLPDLATREGQVLIEQHLGGVKLLVIDNLSCLVRTGKENESEAWLPVQDWALSLRKQGISILFLHHDGKSGTQRGTSRREDVLDTVLALRNPSDYKSEDGLRVEIYFEKCRSLIGSAVKPFEVKLETLTGSTEWTSRDVEDVKRIEVLRLREEGNSVRDIAEELGLSKSTVARWIKKGTVPV